MGMTMDEQAQALEDSYVKFHRMTTQPHRTAADRAEALQRLKGQLLAADQTLRLPATRETATARRKLTLWAEMTRGDLKQLGQDVVPTDA